MKPRSLNFWLTAYLGAAWLVLLLALGLILWQSVHQVLEQAQADKSRALAAQLAAVAVDAVLLRDYGSLERSVSDLVKDSGLAHVEIRRADGELLAQAGIHAVEYPLQRVPLLAAGETLGEVAVQYDSGTSRAAAWRVAGLLAAGLALFSLFAFFGLRRLLIARLITPVRALLEQADLERPSAPAADTPAEIRELAAALSGLQKRVAEHVAALEEAAQVRNEALRRLCGEQRLATVGQLAGEVAHELNTPLANILCYAQLELPRASDDDSRLALETIVAQARRAGVIVRDMLTVARAPAVQSENLDLAALAATFVRLLAPLAGRQGAQVVLDAANETRVRADASRLEQILFNLATNALQAGARLIEVRVTADPASVTVRDDGPGVDAAVRERLFEPFVTSKPAGQGTGLGLAICKRLAEEMNGHLTLLTSRPGETVFQLQLPDPALEET
jgi:signal transduction histidine kinase